MIRAEIRLRFAIHAYAGVEGNPYKIHIVILADVQISVLVIVKVRRCLPVGNNIDICGTVFQVDFRIHALHQVCKSLCVSHTYRCSFCQSADVISFPVSEDTVGQSGSCLLGIFLNRLIRSHVAEIRDLCIHDLRISTFYRCLSFFRRKIFIYLCLHLCGNLFPSQMFYNICAGIRCNRIGILCHILFRISVDVFFCCIRILCLILLCYSAFDRILPYGKSHLLFRHCTELTLKLRLDLRTIHLFHCSINLIIMLILLRLWCSHDRLIAHLVHDIRHIKRVILRQPGVQHQNLLNVRLCSGVFYRLQSFISLCADCIPIVFNSKLISVQEVHDHTGQVVIGIISTSYIVNRNTCQSKHLAKYSQTVFPIVIKLEIERTLYAKYVGIILPLLLVLSIHTQNCLDLLFCQCNRFSIGVKDLDILQFFFDRSDLRITLVNRIQFLFSQLHLVDIDLRRLDFGCINSKGRKTVLNCEYSISLRSCFGSLFLWFFCCGFRSLFLRFLHCFRSCLVRIFLCSLICNHSSFRIAVWYGSRNWSSYKTHRHGN